MKGQPTALVAADIRDIVSVLLKSHSPISVIVIITATPLCAYSVNTKEIEAHGGYVTSLSPITGKAVSKIQTQARL